MREPAYLGIDASKSSLGLCAVPRSWDGDWSRIECATLELKPQRTEREQIIGMLALARDVRIFAIRCGVQVAVIEDVPTHDAFSIKPLAELRGFIRSELARECGIYVEPVNQSSARKTFLGYLPTSRKGGPRVNRKQVVVTALDALTDVFQWDDEKDAFITVNHRMARDTGVHVIELNAPNPNAAIKPVRKPRKRAA